MKRYMKNKDFIPEKFYNKMELNRNKKENGIFTLFLILNLVLIPITAKDIREVELKPVVYEDNADNNNQNKIDLNDINIWIESIIKDNVEEACINGNKGDVVVNNLDGIDDLSSNTSIVISDVNQNSNGKYKLGVSLNE